MVIFYILFFTFWWNCIFISTVVRSDSIEVRHFYLFNSKLLFFFFLIQNLEWEYCSINISTLFHIFVERTSALFAFPTVWRWPICGCAKLKDLKLLPTRVPEPLEMAIYRRRRLTWLRGKSLEIWVIFFSLNNISSILATSQFVGYLASLCINMRIVTISFGLIDRMEMKGQFIWKRVWFPFISTIKLYIFPVSKIYR